MKKWVFYLFLPLFIQAQSVQVDWNAFFISAQPNQTVQFHGILQLQDTAQLELAMVRKVTTQPSDWTSSLCVGIQCYSPDVDTAWFTADTRNDLDVYLDINTGSQVGIGIYEILFVTRDDTIPLQKYQFKVSTDPQGIGDENHTPRNLILYPPYPNPFNPIVYIPFNVKSIRYSTVKFSIMDITGRLILEKEIEVNGSQKQYVQWNGTDSRGNRLPSGIYFYHFRLKDEVATGKIILMK